MKSFKEAVLPTLIGVAIGVILLFVAAKIGENEEARQALIDYKKGESNE